MKNTTQTRYDKTRRRLATGDWSGLRALSYARCSTDDQAHGDYTTIDSQKAINAKRVAERGARLVFDLTDEGKTGTNLERAGWKNAIAHAESGAVDFVIVTYMSRLGRGDAFTVGEYLLKQTGCTVFMVQEKFADDTAGYAQKKMTNFLDGMYPVQVREWTLTRMIEMFGRGYHVGGGIAFGYKTVPAWEAPDPHAKKQPPRLLVPDESLAPIIAGVFTVALRTRRVADAQAYLSDATGKAWGWKQTDYVLRNRVYRGEYRWRDLVRGDEGGTVAGHTPLVDAAVFDAVQEMLAATSTQEEASCRRPRRTRTTELESSPDQTGTVPDRSVAPETYYLHGLMYCGHCCYTSKAAFGSHPSNQENAAFSRFDGCDQGRNHYRMSNSWASGRGGNRVPYYECLHKMHYKKQSDCPVCRVNANKIHEAIVREVTLMAAHPWRVRQHIERALPRMPRPESLIKERDAAQKRLADARRRMANLIEAVAVSGAAVVAALSGKIVATQSEVNALSLESARLEKELVAATASRPDTEELATTLSLFARIWEHRTDAERCQLMPLIVERVTMETKRVARVMILPQLSEDLFLPDAEGAGEGAVGATSPCRASEMRPTGSTGSMIDRIKGRTSRYARTAFEISITLPTRRIYSPSPDPGPPVSTHDKSGDVR